VTRWAVLLLPAAGLLAIDGSGDAHALKLVVLLAAAFACCAAALERRRLAWSSVAWALWIFVAVRGLMLVRSPMTGRALRWFALLVALALAHHAACAAAPRRWLAAWAPRVLGGLGAGLGLLAVVQALSPDVAQASALFANRNFAGAGLAMLLPYALAARWPLAALTGLGVVATTSRGGLLAAAAAAALWVAWRPSRLRWPVALGLPALVLAAGLLAGESNTVKVRFHWYRAALDMGLANPAVGLGEDGFMRAYPPVRPEEEYSISGGDRVHAVHDDYLESFANGGALGLGAHLLLLLVAARALRRNRVAAASLLAFAVASLVDLPLRDPSLLALAVFGLSFAPRRAAAANPIPATLVALLAIGSLYPEAFWHWRAEHALAEGRVDDALTAEPRHPEALMIRRRPADLDALLLQEPHHADARYQKTRDLPRADALPALREILERHDPHHTLTHVRIAQLVFEDDPVRAVALLEDAVRVDPRPWEPWWMLARVYRASGNRELTDKYLRAAEERAGDPRIAAERLDLEIAEVKEGRLDRGPILRAVRALPPSAVVYRIGRELLEAKKLEDAAPLVRLRREEAEDAASFAQRIAEAKATRDREVDEETRPHYLAALVVSGALCHAAPGAEHYRLLAQAARGLNDNEGAARAEGLALFVEVLDALVKGDEAAAAARLDRALRTHPDLAAEGTVRDALGRFSDAHPDARDRARRVLRDHPELFRHLGP